MAEKQRIKKDLNPILKGVLVVAGTLSLGLGLIGIVVPLLPTTPFLLLAAACYARSSGRFYRWLTTNRLFGKYIRDYRENRGIPVKVKVLSLAFLWATILISVFLISQPVVFILLPLIAAAVTAHILRIRNRK